MDFDLKTGKVNVGNEELSSLLDLSNLSTSGFHHEALPRPQDWETQREDYIARLNDVSVEVIKEDPRFIAVRYRGDAGDEQTRAMNEVIGKYFQR